LYDETKNESHRIGKNQRQYVKRSATLPVGYANLLASLKTRVRAAQLRAMVPSIAS
jgi:hypothetical protein